jgi:hypothetical protein
MNDRPLGHACAILEGSVEILEDAVHDRESIDNSYLQRMIAAAQRLAAACKEAQSKA